MRVCPRCHGQYPDDSRFCPRDGAPLPGSDGDPRVGTTLFGQFALLEVCGKGAMGTVYRAWQTGMDRQVAVKILRSELLRDPSVVKRFHREARAVARIQHPNIVTVFVVGETEDGLPYLVMEYVEGEVLSDVLHAGDAPTPLEPLRALRITRQIASALADAHAEGVVHRDLKPANILLSQRRRAADFVKVLDFGIAKILRSEVGVGEIGGESHLTRSGTIFGTPHYIAPEQASGGDVDHRADLYSMGVILYRMLSGQLPFEGTGIAVLLAHVQRTPPRLSEVRPDLDPRLDTLVMRLLAKHPAERFQTAEALSDAIDALLVGTPAAAGLSWASFPAASAATSDLHMRTVRGVPSLVQATSPSAPASLSLPAPTPPGLFAAGGALETVVDSPETSTAPVTPHAPLIAPPGPFGRDVAPAVAGDPDTRAEPPLYLDSGTAYESWRPPRGRARTAIIAGVIAVLCAGAAVAAAYFLGRTSSAPAADTASNMAGPAAPAPGGGASDAGVPRAVKQPPPPPKSARPVDTGVAAPVVAWRIVTLGEAGYAVRVLLPPRLEVDTDIEIVFEAWDPEGRPFKARELRVTLEEPGGVQRALSVPLTGAPGRYLLHRRFLVPGHHHMHIQLDPKRPKLHVWSDFDVVPRGEGTDSHAVAPAHDHGRVVVRPPADPRPLPMPPLEPLEPMPVVEPPSGGPVDAGVEPYHILDEPPAPVGRPDAASPADHGEDGDGVMLE